MRTIDADALIESIKRQCGICKLMPDEEIRELAVVMEKGLIEEVNNAPTVEPKRGEWIDISEWYAPRQKCSICEMVVDGYGSNYCPNCGADMRGEDNEQTN